MVINVASAGAPLLCVCGALLIFSLAGTFPVPMSPVYAAAKAGVVHFTRSMTALHQKDRIRVCALAPTYAKTPMVAAMGAELMRQGAIKASSPEDVRPAPQDEMHFAANPPAHRLRNKSLKVSVAGWKCQVIILCVHFFLFACCMRAHNPSFQLWSRLCSPLC